MHDVAVRVWDSERHNRHNVSRLRGEGLHCKHVAHGLSLLIMMF